MVGAHKRTRVLHIIQSLNYGGMERLLFEMLRRANPDQFEHHVLNLQFVGRFGEGLSEYASVSVASPMGRGSFLYPRSLARDVAAIAPDVVHTHSGVWFKASLAARMAGVPWLVHTEHGRPLPDTLLGRYWDRTASRRTNVVVAVSKTVSDLLKDRVGVRADRVRIVHNGVDTDRFCPQPDDGRFRAALGLAPDVPIIGSIGRLEPIKGYEVMVEAFALLRRGWRHPPAPVLVVAGDGSQRRTLVEQSRAAGMADHIIWLGWRDDIHHLHAAFSIFTMSSHSEGTSVSLLEAMSAAVCPVVTNVGGNAHVLGDALQSCLVPQNNPQALARAWEELLQDASPRLACGRAGRARVVASFGIDAMVRAYERLYACECGPELSV